MIKFELPFENVSLDDSVDREENEVSSIANLEGYTKLAEKDQEFLCKAGSDHEISDDDCYNPQNITFASSTRGSLNKDSREYQQLVIKGFFDVLMLAVLSIKENMVE